MSGSLEGKTILVTRPREQAEGLKKTLEGLGARVLLQPAIEILPPKDWSGVDSALELIAQKRVDWVVFSSANGVRFALERAGEKNIALFRSDLVKIATVGSGTTSALKERGIDVQLEPKSFDAEGVFDALRERCEDLSCLRFVSFRASRGRKVLADALRAVGASIVEVETYRSVDVQELDPEIADALREGKIDCVTAMSSASAKALRRLMGDDAEKTRWAALSPLTADALRDSGIEADVVAREATAQGLVDAIVAYYGATR